MQLTLTSHKSGNVAIIACSGRIVTGEETRALQLEVEKLTLGSKNVVLDLAGVAFIDSGGLGALVRLRGILRANHGDVKLCNTSTFVHKVLEATKLLQIFQTFNSEQEAIHAFSARPHSPEQASHAAKAKILCVDSSSDLLAYLSALIQRLGYECFTAKQLNDAALMIKVRKPHLVICGPGIRGNEIAVEKLRHSDPSAKMFLLDADFSTAEATHTGAHLAERIQGLLAP
jgi:anti-sigma B factor antagonist